MNHCLALFNDFEWTRPFLDGITFKAISNELASHLEAPFEELEIKEAVWNCGGSKVPGPDSFNFNFIRRVAVC